MEEVELKEEKKGHHILIKILLFLLTIVGLVFCYMYFFEPKTIITHEYAIVNEALPDSFNGFKIAHFSDIHFGRTTNEKEVQKVVSLLNEMKPDIIVFTGDLFDNYITLSEDNKEFLRSRMKKEENPAVRKLLEKDLNYLDRIQVQMATAREFLILIRLQGEKETEVFPYLSRIEKSLKEQGFSVKRADKEDIKRILAVYYEQNVTTERFEDFDGERWMIPYD